MKEDWYRVIGWILVALVALCGVSAVLHILVNVLPRSGAADWVVAIGTVGTLIGTIWLATSQQRRINREGHAAAVLAAARYVPEVADLHTKVNEAAAAMDKQEGFAQGVEVFQETLDKIRQVEMWSSIDLKQLAPLPNQCALNLVHALGNVQAAKVLLETMLRNKRVRTDHGYRYDAAKLIAARLHSASEFFGSAGKQLSESANQALSVEEAKFSEAAKVSN